MKAIHHIDGDPRNNDLENLRVVDTKRNAIMKVYVVMGNDYPEAVFKLEAEAVKFCSDKKKERGMQKPVIYWRTYEFELR
jgi:hypothetical protein